MNLDRFIEGRQDIQEHHIDDHLQAHPDVEGVIEVLPPGRPPIAIYISIYPCNCFSDISWVDQKQGGHISCRRYQLG